MMALDRFRTSLEQLHPQLEQVIFEIAAEPAEFPERLSEARRNTLHNGVSNAKKRLKIEQDKKEPDAVKVSELEAAVRARMAERDRATERHRAWMRTPAGQEADAAWRARAVEKRRRVEASAAEEKGDSSRLSDKEIIDDLRARADDAEAKLEEVYAELKETKDSYGKLLDAAEDRNLRLRDEVRKLRKELDTARSN